MADTAALQADEDYIFISALNQLSLCKFFSWLTPASQLSCRHWAMLANTRALIQQQLGGCMHLCEGVIVPRRVATSVDARKGWVKWLVVQTLARRASQSSSYPGRDGNEREDDAHNPMAAAMRHDPQASATAQVPLHGVYRVPPPREHSSSWGCGRPATLSIPRPCAGCGAIAVPTGWAAARSTIASRGPWPCSRSPEMKQRSCSVTPCSSYPSSPYMQRRMARPTGAVRPIRRDAARMSPPARRHAVSFIQWGCKATAVPHDCGGDLLLYPAG